MIIYIDHPPIEKISNTFENYAVTEERRHKLAPAFAFRAISLTELRAAASQSQNAVKIPNPYAPLFRNDPRSVPEAFAAWEEFAAPPEPTHEEQYLHDFMSELEDYLRKYDRMMAVKNSKAAAMCKEGILIMIASFKASGHSVTSPELDTKINGICDELSVTELAEAAA